LLLPCPRFDISLEGRQVSIPSHVGFREKGKGVMKSGQLCGLMSLAEASFLRVFDDSLPNLPGEGLISIGCNS
jgi:hypothetical protein